MLFVSSVLNLRNKIDYVSIKKGNKTYLCKTKCFFKTIYCFVSVPVVVPLIVLSSCGVNKLVFGALSFELSVTSTFVINSIIIIAFLPFIYLPSTSLWGFHPSSTMQFLNPDQILKQSTQNLKLELYEVTLITLLSPNTVPHVWIKVGILPSMCMKYDLSLNLNGEKIR